MKVNIVWTAVGALVFGLASFLAAWQNSVPWTIALGFSALTSATLASRER